MSCIFFCHKVQRMKTVMKTMVDEQHGPPQALCGIGSAADLNTIFSWNLWKTANMPGRLLKRRMVLNVKLSDSWDENAEEQLTASGRYSYNGERKSRAKRWVLNFSFACMSVNEWMRWYSSVLKWTQKWKMENAKTTFYGNSKSWNGKCKNNILGKQQNTLCIVFFN